MDSDDQAVNWLETAKHYISKCNPIPLPEAQTYYVKLWNCRFSREGASNLSSAFVPPENGDPEVQRFLEEIYKNAERNVAIPGLGDKLERVYRGPPRLEGLEELPQGVNVALGKAIGPWDKAELYSKNEVIRCLIQKGMYKFVFWNWEHHKSEYMEEEIYMERALKNYKNALEVWKMDLERNGWARELLEEYAGSCELIIQRSPPRRMEDPSQKPHLPFDGDTTMALVRALDLNLQWLSDRGNDSGTIRVGFAKGNGRRYVFQSPFYKKGSWTLAITVQYPGSPLEEVIKLLQEDSQSLKIVGILEVDHSLNLSTLLDEVHLSALGCCHPLLLPITLLEHHVQESAGHFITISQKLSSLEDAIDPSAAEKSLLATTPTPGNSSQQSYGVLSKEVYECNKSLFELERRRDYEKRLQDFLTHDIRFYRDENWVKLDRRLDNIKAVSSDRNLDIKSLPRRIEALTNLIRNLVAQQDSQATIQIARSTMQENVQMTELTEATMKDSNAMKNIAVLTTIFLPGTYIASLFSTTMFNFSDSTGLQISSHFWIYWVITIPLTIIAFGSLQALIKYRGRKEETDVGVKEREKEMDEEKGIVRGNRVGLA